MTLKDVKAHIPEWSRDIRLNLESVLSEKGSPGLAVSQIWGIALACSYSVGSEMLSDAILHEGQCDDATVAASKSAATMMAMTTGGVGAGRPAVAVGAGMPRGESSAGLLGRRL